MNIETFAHILCEQAEKYCKSKAYRKIVRRLSDKPIDTVVVCAIILPFLGRCLPILPHGTYWRLTETLGKWLPDAPESIHRNGHMNNANGKRTINQDTADALLVDYVNYTVLPPLDLALYARDIRNDKSDRAKA